MSREQIQDLLIYVRFDLALQIKNCRSGYVKVKGVNISLSKAKELSYFLTDAVELDDKRLKDYVREHRFPDLGEIPEGNDLNKIREFYQSML